MRDYQNQHNYRLSSASRRRRQPSQTPEDESSVRKSRTERLQELRAMLESGMQKQPTPSQSMDTQSSHQMTAWKPVVPAPQTPPTPPPLPINY